MLRLPILARSSQSQDWVAAEWPRNSVAVSLFVCLTRGLGQNEGKRLAKTAWNPSSIIRLGRSPDSGSRLPG